MLIAVVAMDQSNVIGFPDGSIPWDCAADRKFFKDFVKDKWKIVGRKTWNSIKKYPWASDRTYVYSKEKWSFYLANGDPYEQDWDGSNLDSALKLLSYESREYIVIGGAEIYALAAPYVSTIYVTRIDRSTCNAAKAVKFPWKEYFKFQWKEEHHMKLEEGVNVFKLTKLN